MFYITGIFIGAISGFLPLLPIVALFHFITLKKIEKNNIKQAIPHIIAVYIFCFSLTGILSVTGIPDVYSLKVNISVNFIPFVDIFTNSIQYVLNILLFGPIGFLLPMLWSKFEKKHLTIIWGFLFSLSIEIIQIFSLRTTDIDDLIMNTLGTIVGYFFFILIKKFFPKISVFAINQTNHWKYEPYVCFSTAWLSMVFIQSLILNWAWGLILR